MSGQKLGYKRKKQATKNLERAATAAARKPVYVVDKQDRVYLIQNYYDNTHLEYQIRTRALAELLAETINATGMLSASAAKELEYVEKLLTDMVHYYHMLEQKSTGPMAETMDHRIALTRDRIQNAEHKATQALKSQLRNCRKDK